MEITMTGKLIHVHTPQARQGDEQRFSLQILNQPKQGNTSAKAVLETFNLPKGTNPNFYTSHIGKDLTVNLEPWNANGRSGFFIRDVKDITFHDIAKSA